MLNLFLCPPSRKIQLPSHALPIYDVQHYDRWGLPLFPVKPGGAVSSASSVICLLCVCLRLFM